MTQTVSTTQAGGIVNFAVVKIDTDSTTAVQTIVPVGFLPRSVQFINLTDRISDEWFTGMAADSALHTVAAGTRTLVTSGGITCPVTGATVDVDSTMAVAKNGTIAAAGPSTIAVGTTLAEGFVLIPAALMVASKSHVLIARG